MLLSNILQILSKSKEKGGLLASSTIPIPVNGRKLRPFKDLFLRRKGIYDSTLLFFWKEKYYTASFYS